MVAPDLIVEASETQPLLHSSPPSSTRHSQKDEDSIIIEDVSLRNEARILLRYSGPLVLTYFLQYAYQVIIIVVAAQLSTAEIAGVSLGITTSNITGFAVFDGMATALDSLCSQAYGSSRLPDVGLYLIRGTILIHLVAVLPVGILWLSSQPVIDALVPDAELATHASSFLWWTLIGVPGYVVFENGKRFMQAQGNFTAGLVVLLICLPINVGLTYFLAVVVDMRVAGAALSSSITNLLRPLLLAAYAMFVKRSTLKCWPTAAEIAAGWWTEWGTILKLAVPGAMMTLSEWLCFEILTFCVSYVSTEALAAQSFLATVATLIWHIPFSASIACSTRVGQLVGAGRTDSTSRVMKWYALVFIVTGLLDCVLGLGLVYGMLRTIVHDARVARIIKATLPAFTFFVFFDAMANWPHAIVRGYGWQYIGAWCTVTINYLYAVPLSMFLELGPPLMGIGGLWAGLGSALALTTISEAVAIWIKLGKAEEQAREVADAEDDGE